VISLLAGVTFSPHATDLVKPLEYTGSQANLNAVTLYFSRLVLGVQLVLAGVQLPSRYLQKEWKPLALLLGPIMTSMWLASSLIIWGMVPNLSFVHALAVGACVTPTDPVLSNSIVKGKFADKNVPKDLQKIIVAESGANDGLGCKDSSEAFSHGIIILTSSQTLSFSWPFTLSSILAKEA